MQIGPNERSVSDASPGGPCLPEASSTAGMVMTEEQKLKEMCAIQLLQHRTDGSRQEVPSTRSLNLIYVISIESLRTVS